MKRLDLIRHLYKQGCVLAREGARHTIFFHPALRRTSSVPRHSEVQKDLARKICKDLGVTPP